MTAPSTPLDVIDTIRPGDIVPIMRKVVRIENGAVYFWSDDGKVAYGRYQDVRDAMKGMVNTGSLFEEYKTSTSCEHDYTINHAGPVNTKCIKCGYEIEG